jgi:hypothetical protein
VNIPKNNKKNLILMLQITLKILLYASIRKRLSATHPIIRVIKKLFSVPMQSSSIYMD